MSEPELPLSDEVFHQLLAMLRARRRHARRLIDANGLKPREFSVLRRLHENGPATVGQIQAYMHNSASTASSLINQLEQGGLVNRDRSDEDNRVVIVSLTEQGRTIAARGPLVGLPLLRRRMGALRPERLLRIQDVLAEVTKMMEADEPE